jgi:hypothetical protein
MQRLACVATFLFRAAKGSQNDLSLGKHKKAEFCMFQKSHSGLSRTPTSSENNFLEAVSQKVDFQGRRWMQIRVARFFLVQHTNT